VTALYAVLRTDNLSARQRLRAMATLGDALANLHFGNGELVSVGPQGQLISPRHGDCTFNNFFISDDQENVLFIDTVGMRVSECVKDIQDVTYGICRDFATGRIGHHPTEEPLTYEDCQKLVATFLRHYERRARELLREEVLSQVDLRQLSGHAAAAALEKIAHRAVNNPRKLYGPVDTENMKLFLANYQAWQRRLGMDEAEAAALDHSRF
jgi:hypothetical protein